MIFVQEARTEMNFAAEMHQKVSWRQKHRNFALKIIYAKK